MARAALSLVLLALLAGSALAQYRSPLYKSPVYKGPSPSPSYQKSPPPFKSYKPIVFTIFAKLQNSSAPIPPVSGTAGTRVVSLWDIVDYKGYKIGYLTGYATTLFGTQILNKYTVVLKGGSLQVIGTDDGSLVFNAETVVGGTGKYAGLTGYVSTQSLTSGSASDVFKLIFYLLDDAYYTY